MDSLKISVIIPVYNVEKYLHRCLDSVINQTYSNLEIILINDGSCDASGKICDEFAARDVRIRCVHQENAGVSKARNLGIAMASGDFYHFLDSDDYIEPDTYEYLLRKMQESGTDAIGFEYFVTYSHSECAHKRASARCGTFDTEGAVREHLFGGNNFLCTKLLPAAVTKDLRFHEDIFRDEDTLFGFEAIRKVHRMSYIDRPLLHYVQSEESACRGKFRPNQLSAIKVIPMMEATLSSDFPNLLPLWRIGYLHLMIMLYTDMYLDKENYQKEQKEIYKVFRSLYQKVGLKNIKTFNNRIKFFIFLISPQFFCWLHKCMHKL